MAGAGTVITKLVPAVLAVTIVEVGAVVLQVTLSALPKVLSGVTNIWLLVVTAVVLTVTVVAAAATLTEPAAAEPQVPPEL